jgi:hypothetical protein
MAERVLDVVQECQGSAGSSLEAPAIVNNLATLVTVARLSAVMRYWLGNLLERFLG